MSKTLERVQALAARGEVKISLHGYEELDNDHIRVREALAGLATAIVVEDYPTYPKGPCVLVLERDGEGQPIHVVWGIPVSHDGPAVLVTGYQPVADQWDASWQRRRR